MKGTWVAWNLDFLREGVGMCLMVLVDNAKHRGEFTEDDRCRVASYIEPIVTSDGPTLRLTIGLEKTK